MTTTTSEILDVVYMSMQPMWAELSFLFCFILGYIFLKGEFLAGGKKKPKKIVEEGFDLTLRKNIEADTAAGSASGVLKHWRAGQAAAPTPELLLKQVVQAFLNEEPDALVEEVVGHMTRHSTALSNTRVAVMILDTVSRAGNVKAMMELWNAFQTKLNLSRSLPLYEVLLAGFASAGNQSKVSEVVKKMRADKLGLSARAFSLMIKGFLKNGMLDEVLSKMTDMHGMGYALPTFAVAQLFRLATEASRSTEVFQTVKNANLPLPAEAMEAMLEDCAKRGDFKLARQVEKLTRETQDVLPASSYDALLKVYTLAGDIHVLDIFKEMQESGARINEGLCVGLLARCAESKFLNFAEEIVAYTRANGQMTIATYSALMKVYAFCGMYDKACYLYDRIREDGLVPDQLMYGCLMKFAAECGRTSLSEELSQKAPALDIQNYMSLIRSAGRDRDVKRAFAVLKRLKESPLTPDIASYNCVLDVCVQSGDMRRAKELVHEMREMGLTDIITFNTLLKGHCATHDLKGAKELLGEIELAGLKPNDASYNCLINIAASSGDFNEAFQIVDLMQSHGVKADHYTLSILMKAMKKVKNQKAVVPKVLDLLDRTQLDVCADEILFNAVLDTCIRHRETSRLENILNSYTNSRLRPSVHTYGSLIKACNVLKRPNQCWQFWQEMEEKRGTQPNDVVLGCMLDALVCNDKVEDAVQLFNKWKSKVSPNIVLYATLMKGFANTKQADRAMEAFEDMQKQGLEMSTVVYNSVIDAHARLGLTEEVTFLVKSMGQDSCEMDCHTYTHIVKSYCCSVTGHMDAAFEVFQTMQTKHMAGDSVVYNTMLDGCNRHGRADLAEKLIQEMDRSRVVPTNYTLGIIVRLYGRWKMLDKAVEVTETMPRRHNFSLNSQVLTSLMVACINNSALDRALQVLEDIKDAHREADEKAYAVIIKGCVRYGQLLKALALVDEVYGMGESWPAKRCAHALDSEAVEGLLKALKQKGMLQSHAVPLLERLRAAKVNCSRFLASVR
mmetsp:Transcript_12858/g.23021  ORF Transcript_12858/g.23021 Transcript_12858/m.23021 type:complete len:1016 (-) Transcript_12858:59-3106(-)